MVVNMQVNNVIKRYIESEIASTLFEACAVCGITRLSRLTNLDKTGVKVWSACRPASMLWQVSAGKGLNESDAIISAIMESLEGYAVECFLRSKSVGLYSQPTNPINLNLISTESFKLIGSQFSNKPLYRLWIDAIELKTGSRVQVPLHWAYLCNDIISSGWVTNGLSAGLSRKSAISHGLYELIERHYLSDVFVTSKADIDKLKVLDINTLPDSFCDFRKLIDFPGAEVNFLICNQAPVPTVWCIVFDFDPPCTNLYVNFGSKSSEYLKVSIQASFTEACQQRVSQLQGSREDLSPNVPIHNRDQISRLKNFILTLNSISYNDIAMPNVHSLHEFLPGPVYQIELKTELPFRFFKHVAPVALFKHSIF